MGFPSDNEASLSCSSIAEMKRTQKKRRPRSAKGYIVNGGHSTRSSRLQPGRVQPKKNTGRMRPHSAKHRSDRTFQPPSAANLASTRGQGWSGEVASLYQQVHSQSQPEFRPHHSSSRNGRSSPSQVEYRGQIVAPPTQEMKSAAIWSSEEKENAMQTLLDQKCYSLDTKQQKIFDQFTSMLAGFDPFVVDSILVTAKEAAHGQTGLSDYFGAGGDL